MTLSGTPIAEVASTTCWMLISFAFAIRGLVTNAAFWVYAGTFMQAD